jgi:O-antigen/teichoic acid export membrane protein/glycosyltransferase involved in cell wall biosynthesis
VKFSLKNSLARNFGWMLAGQGLGYGLRILYFIVIARLLGVLHYGIVVGAFALVNIAAQYGRLGMSTVLLRYVSADHKRFAAYWGNLLVVTFTTGGLLIVLMRVLAPRVVDPASASIVVFMAVGSCLCEQLTIGATQAFQSLERMEATAALNQMTSMLRTITAIGMLVTLHHASATQWAIASMLASAVGTAIALIAVTVRLGWPQFKPSLLLRSAGEGFEYAFASSTTNVYDDIDKTMLSHYGMDEANGIYGMAYRIIEMATVPIASIQLATEPRLFRLAASGPAEPILLGRRLLKYGLLISGAAAVCLFVVAPIIPLLAGKGFTEGISALRWLCLIPLFRSVHKLTGSVLTSIGLQRYRTLTQLAVACLNFGLNLWLIPRYGWRGAAWASLATDGSLGIMNWTLLQRTCRKLSSAETNPAGLAGVVRSDTEAVTTAPNGSLAYGNVSRVENPLPGSPMISNPLVSIVIAYYQHPDFIAEAVLSAKRQTYTNTEIIVVDDGSPEPVEPRLRHIGGLQIWRTENRGVSAARNFGCRKSSGEHLIFLDSDDVLAPGAVEAHLKVLLSTDAALSFGAIRLVDENGTQLRPPHSCRQRQDYFKTLLESNPIGCPGAAMIRRKAFLQVGMFDESLRICEDYDLYLRIARQMPVGQCSSWVVDYRRHRTNISQAKERMFAVTMTVLDRIETTLTKSELKRLRHARRRWKHEFLQQATPAYRIWSLYYSFRAMLTVPVRFYFTQEH